MTSCSWMLYGKPPRQESREAEEQQESGRPLRCTSHADTRRRVWETLVLGRTGSVSIRPAFALWMLVQNSVKRTSKQARLPAQLCVCRRVLSLVPGSLFSSRLWSHFQAAPSQESSPSPPGQQLAHRAHLGAQCPSVVSCHPGRLFRFVRLGHGVLSPAT